MSTSQQFGGDWTDEKLERVRKYLVAYATIMKDYSFRFAYIDAFAGTGYRNRRASDETSSLMFGAFDDESQQFLDGSAKIALEVEPRFDTYIFVEKNETRFKELEGLKEEFPDKQNSIQLVNEDANGFLQQLCTKDWETRRAVLFLDPFGMLVEWQTIEAIARTEAIDLWYLFPLGVAVNRLLRKDGRINDSWRSKLDSIFGTEKWFDEFYQKDPQELLWSEEEPTTEKSADFDKIGRFFVRRLEQVFAKGGVAKNPRPLYNRCNNPLYLLCFAAGNPKGAKTAVKIAQEILKR